MHLYFIFFQHKWTVHVSLCVSNGSLWSENTTEEDSEGGVQSSRQKHQRFVHVNIFMTVFLPPWQVFFIFIICTAGEEYFHLRVIFFFPELEQKLETQERENKKMEIANKGESCRVEHRSLILHLFTNKWKIPSVCPHQIFLPVSELILEVRELKKCCSDNSAHCGGCCSFTALICVDTGLFHTFWRFKKKNSIVLSHRFTKTTSAES